MINWEEFPSILKGVELKILYIRKFVDFYLFYLIPISIDKMNTRILLGM